MKGILLECGFIWKVFDKHRIRINVKFSGLLGHCGPALMLLAKRLKGFSAYLPPTDQKYSFTRLLSVNATRAFISWELLSPRNIAFPQINIGRKEGFDRNLVEVFAFTGILHLHLLTKHLFEANIRFRANKRFLSSANKTVFTIASWENFEKV